MVKKRKQLTLAIASFVCLGATGCTSILAGSTGQSASPSSIGSYDFTSSDSSAEIQNHTSSETLSGDVSSSAIGTTSQEHVHSWDNGEVTTPSTCTKNGSKTYTCSDCGATKIEEISALGHDFSDYVSNHDATCEHDGTKTGSCSRCGETNTITDPGTKNANHDLVYHPAVEATCEKTGSEDYYTCTRCDYVSPHRTIPAYHHLENSSCKDCGKSIFELSKHSFGYDPFSSYTNAQSLKDFYQSVCSSLQKVYFSDESINNDFSFGYASYGLSNSEALSMGIRILNDNPLFYFLSSELSVSNSFLTFSLNKEYVEASARKAVKNSIDAWLNSFDSSLPVDASDYDVAWFAHDAILESVEYAYDDNGNPSTEIDAHSIVNVCKGQNVVCEGYAKAFQLLLDMNGVSSVFVGGEGSNEDHAWNLVKLDDSYYWVDLTWDDVAFSNWSDEDFYKQRRAYFLKSDDSTILYAYTSFSASHTLFSSDKDQTIDSGAYDFPLPDRALQDYEESHDILFGEEFTVDDITYRLTFADGLQALDFNQEENLVFPDLVMHEGRSYIVKGVGRLYHDYGVTGNGSFMKTVKTVHIPSSVVYLSYAWSTFLYDKNGNRPMIESFEVDENNPYYSDYDGALFSKDLTILYCYPCGSKNSVFEMPNQTKYAARHAFCNDYGKGFNPNLKKLIISSSLELMGFVDISVYPGCIIGQNITDGWHLLFYEDRGDFVLDTSKNPWFYVDGDFLMQGSTAADGDYKLLVTLMHPKTKNLIIPDGTTNIESDAFKESEAETITCPSSLRNLGCVRCMNYLKEIRLNEGLEEITSQAFFGDYALKTINLPSTLKIIGWNAFGSCGLTSIYLPKSIKSMGNSIFENCKDLKDIYLEASEEEIASIYPANWIGGECSPTLHYNSSKQSA